MQEEIKCPQCGGNKFSDRGNNTYKCMYCGTTFNVKKPDEPKHTNYSELESAAPKVTVMSVLIRNNLFSNNPFNKDIIPNIYLQKVKRQLRY